MLESRNEEVKFAVIRRHLIWSQLYKVENIIYLTYTTVLSD